MPYRSFVSKKQKQKKLFFSKAHLWRVFFVFALIYQQFVVILGLGSPLNPLQRICGSIPSQWKITATTRTTPTTTKIFLEILRRQAAKQMQDFFFSNEELTNLVKRCYIKVETGLSDKNKIMPDTFVFWYLLICETKEPTAICATMLISGGTGRYPDAITDNHSLCHVCYSMYESVHVCVWLASIVLISVKVTVRKHGESNNQILHQCVCKLVYVHPC